MPHITLLLLLEQFLIKLEYLFDVLLACIALRSFRRGLFQYLFDCPPEGVLVRAWDQARSTRAHTVVGGDDRRPDVQRFTHRDRIAVVKRRAEKQIALRDGAQGGRMRNVAAQRNVFRVWLALNPRPQLR